MSKQFLAVVAAIIIVFVGVILITNNKSNGGAGGNNASVSHHVEGLGKDNVTLVEYGDYQCPYCGEYYSTVKQVQQEYNDQLTFQFVNFPLTSVHANAFAGARAAEAAALQGKFWQMHDLLYEQNQIYYGSNETASTWIGASDPTTFFNQYAQQLGLNVNQFKADYSSTKVNNIINADMNKANNLGVSATPTFYLDGKEIQVSNTVSAFESSINAEIAKKAGKSSTSTTNSGTTQQTKNTSTPSTTTSSSH